MKKDIAQAHVENHLQPGEELIGFFVAQKRVNFLMYMLMGPLAAFTMKFYYVAVTSAGIHFHRVNMWDKFAEHDFFNFEDIAGLKMGGGMLQKPLSFEFKNKRKLKIHAQLKGINNVATIDDKTIQHLNDKVESLS